MSDAGQLDRLLSYQAIEQLAYRYAVAIDGRDLDGLVELFVEDVQVGPTDRGRPALRTFFQRSLREIGVSILHVTNHVIDLDGSDRATGMVYCRAEIAIAEEWVVQAICYQDDYERQGDRWYFRRRRHLLWYGADMLQRPIGLPPANWPEHQTGKGVLPEAWPTWPAFWKDQSP